MMRILIINGPNLNLLGEREPDIYGSETLQDINDWISAHDSVQGIDLTFYQSNHEGQIIDFLHAHRHRADGVVLNAGALTHYSYALADAITACQIPTVEVHISDIHKREEFRKHSVVEPVALKQISGKGKEGYIDAIEILTKPNDSSE